MLITLVKPSLENQFKTFILEKFWLEHPDFKNLVERCWINKDFSSASPFFDIETQLWSRNTFGNILDKSDILEEYKNILKLEEDY